MLGKIMQVAGLAGLGLVLLTASGCASIVHGGPRQVEVTSEPAGARFTIRREHNGMQVHAGTTPQTVSLSPRRAFFRGQRYAVRFEMPGYEPAEATLEPKISGWYAGNLVFGGLLGFLVVDPATGAMWNLAPRRLETPLLPQAALVPMGNRRSSVR